MVLLHKFFPLPVWQLCAKMYHHPSLNTASNRLPFPPLKLIWEHFNRKKKKKEEEEKKSLNGTQWVKYWISLFVVYQDWRPLDTGRHISEPWSSNLGRESRGESLFRVSLYFNGSGVCSFCGGSGCVRQAKQFIKLLIMLRHFGKPTFALLRLSLCCRPLLM